MSYQHTLNDVVEFSGLGVHSGQLSRIKLIPSKPNSGIVFVVMQGSSIIEIPALVENVIQTSRCTKLGIDLISVSTVEHLLAAIYAFHIDNLRIEIEGPEVPILDGCSDLFVKKIQEIGCKKQSEEACEWILNKTVSFSVKDTHLVAIPSNEYKISCTLDYQQAAAIGSQFFSCSIYKESFIEELSTCRTFALYEEVEPLIKQGLIKGGSLDNAVVIKGSEVLNKEGLRFKNEMVRHKMLDIVGDLALIGCRFKAHIIAISPGHFANVELAKLIKNNLSVASISCSCV